MPIAPIRWIAPNRSRIPRTVTARICQACAAASTPSGIRTHAGPSTASPGIAACTEAIAQAQVVRSSGPRTRSTGTTKRAMTTSPPIAASDQSSLLLYMLEGEMVHGHGEASCMTRPGDALQLDGEGAHGPQESVQPPMRFLSVTSYGDHVPG